MKISSRRQIEPSFPRPRDAMGSTAPVRRTVWLDPNDAGSVHIIDQRFLPFELRQETLRDTASVACAIRDMHVRGAGCIGAVAAHGLYLAAREAAASSDFTAAWENRAALLLSTRPTAVNLAWAVDRVRKALSDADSSSAKIQAARHAAQEIADEDVRCCRRIGEHGLTLLRERAASKPSGETLQILTHCNAGWLAFVEHGSATAPIYAAHAAGLPLHVWVDETRPRNQGARLTTWELSEAGVPHTVIADNTGGHLMQRGLVDLVLTGTDRATRFGDVANKIGTYLKALAAADNHVPFYVALPSSTFDWQCEDAARDIPIEERDPAEVTHIEGWEDDSGRFVTVRLSPNSSAAANWAFDITPARLITALITERGVCRANEEDIARLFPERDPAPGPAL
ncbi:MAG TPA: S-methyl-5-thioribose-1-phosphate isomerase [Verrucomicrobiales bacterium]|nr:S-methyl-5-thioribose-1-phosphate isomerase [Verrucomicrobiales bacterium]